MFVRWGRVEGDHNTLSGRRVHVLIREGIWLASCRTDIPN